jgi:hypothetical protein
MVGKVSSSPYPDMVIPDLSGSDFSFSQAQGAISKFAVTFFELIGRYCLPASHF